MAFCEHGVVHGIAIGLVHVSRIRVLVCCCQLILWQSLDPVVVLIAVALGSLDIERSQYPPQWTSLQTTAEGCGTRVALL